MVVGAFPALKLGVLLFKQISKPIASMVKERAKNNRFFRTYVCMPPAQFYNWCEIQSKMWIMNLGKPVNIPTLNEQQAIELGANLLGEGIIFFVGAFALFFEYNRSSKKEAAKEEERLQEMNYLVSTVKELYFTVQTQDTQIRQLNTTISNLESRVVFKPWALKKGPKDSDEPPPEGPNSTPSNIDPTPGNTGDKSQETGSVPFPNGGIVMKSLNYVELDILNTPQPEINKTERTQKSNVIYDRKPSIISDALRYIEYDLKGLL